MTIKIIQRKDTRADRSGSKPLLLEVCLHGKRARVNLGLSVPVAHWDVNNQKVKKSYILHESINLMILQATSHAYNIVANWNHHKKQLTSNSFVTAYNGQFSEVCKFSDYATKETEKDLSLKYDTLRSYRSHIKKISEFDKNLTLQDIDIQKINDFERFLYSKGNNRNTVRKALSFMRSILNRAIKTDLINKNPFNYKKIGSIHGNRVALSVEQLKALHKILIDNSLDKNMILALKGFLFCCYEGLRYSDFSTLKYSNIISYNGAKYIDITQQKTGRMNQIPLFSQAKELIDWDREARKNERVFKVFSNQYYNRCLKYFATVIKFSKPLTFHCSRHTAACYWIYKKIDIYKISCWLGHSSIKTTEIYLHQCFTSDNELIKMVETKTMFEKTIPDKRLLTNSDT